MLSPVCGLNTTTVMSAIEAMSTSVWPAPTLSTMTGSYRAYSRTRMQSRTDAESAPREPRDAMLRTYTPDPSSPAILALSPMIAPPVTWLVGSTARTAGLIPSEASVAATLAMSVLLPAPAGPVTPTTVDLPQCGNISLSMALARRGSFSTRVSARATAPRLRLRISPRPPIGGAAGALG